MDSGWFKQKMSGLESQGFSHRTYKKARYRLWQEPSKTEPTQPRHHLSSTAASANWHHPGYPFVAALQYSWLRSPYHWALHSTAGVIRNPSLPQESNRVFWLVMLKSYRTRKKKEYLTFSCFYIGEWICLFSLDFHTHDYGPGHSQSQIVIRSSSRRGNLHGVRAEVTLAPWALVHSFSWITMWLCINYPYSPGHCLALCKMWLLFPQGC